jgi:tape measure domain-containing protein
VSENVGKIYYEVTLDTAGMIIGQRRVQGELNKTTGILDGFAGKLTKVAGAVSILATAMAVWKAANMADDIRLLGARIEVAAGSMESGAAAMSALEAISRRTGTSVSANAEVFTRLNQSILQMGGTQQDTLKMTELLGKAIRVSGASAVEAKSAMLQFGQALGSGKLQGDELRSLMENAPYLMRQLADGLGVPVGALKSLGEQGKLTSDVIATALGKAASQIDADFQKFPQTIGSAMDVAIDAALRANSKLDELTGTSAALTGITKGLGEAFDRLAAQLGGANDEAGTLGRNKAIATWADSSKYAISYLIDAVDLVWQSVSVLGRNVAFVFNGIGTEIGGIGAQIAAVMRGDFAGAKAIGDAMTQDAEDRRRALDEADKKALSRAKLAGQEMRAAWEAGAGGGRGSVNPEQASSTLRGTKDPAADKKVADEARKLAAKRLAAQQYYEGLVADTKLAFEKIDAEETKALTENEKRRVADGKNAEIYEKAKSAIVAKYARERSILEDKELQAAADLKIATTTNETERINALRDEAFRRADAGVKNGVITHAEAERQKTLATFNAEQARLDIQERDERARSDARITLAASSERRIKFVRDESVRQAEALYARGKSTFEEMEAAKVKAAQVAKQQMQDLNVQRTATQVATLQLNASTGGSDAQEELIRAQAQASMDAAEQARLLDLENNQIYADQKVAIEEKMHRDIEALRSNANASAMQSTTDIFSSLLDITKRTSGEQSDAYKVMFAAQKAAAIAQSIVAIQTGIAQASALPFPLNLGAMASVAAATAGIVANIQGTNISGARQYGGPTSAGSLYRVNEKGPEMFVGSNGQQYMMPSTGGKVIPADKVGDGGSGVTIIVQNTAPGAVASASYDEQSRTVKIAVAEVANQFRTNTGPVWSAARAGSNIQSRL